MPIKGLQCLQMKNYALLISQFDYFVEQRFLYVEFNNFDKKVGQLCLTVCNKNRTIKFDDDFTGIREFFVLSRKDSGYYILKKYLK
jgi:hypothetical protein